MISIVIPTYNHSVVTLVQDIHSQCVASLPDFEIIVYEDGSTQFIEENSQLKTLGNTKHLVSKENLGRAHARKKLAQTAHFPMLLFLDADVIPKGNDFIKNYLLASQKEIASIFFGGIDYDRTSPTPEKMLRWKYGKKRESLKAKERNKNPYYVISQNLLVLKEAFLKLNVHLKHQYGMDNIFSYQIKVQGMKVMHLDNPVIHLGLENNGIFLEKSLKAVETLVEEEKLGHISHNFTSLQQAYNTLQKYGFVRIFSKIMDVIKSPVRKNLLSKHPNLWLFDLYRLHHYTKLKA